MNNLTKHQRQFFANANEILSKTEEFKTIKELWNFNKETLYSNYSCRSDWLAKNGYLELEVIDKVKYFRRIKTCLPLAEYELYLEKINKNLHKGGNKKEAKPEYNEEDIPALCRVFDMTPKGNRIGTKYGMDVKPASYVLQAKQSTQDLKKKNVRNFVSGQSLGGF